MGLDLKLTGCYISLLFRISCQPEKNIDVLEGFVDDLIIQRDKIEGIILDNNIRIYCNCLVITTGTFLGGKIFIGNDNFLAGRLGDSSSSKLSQTIRKLKFKVGRLKTGTPPRLDKKSINWENIEMQSADEIPIPFSYLTRKIKIPQIKCSHYKNE